MKWTGKKVGLALGGGGARGFAHIGVINVLNKHGIEIDLIVGTSAGALIGGAYALGMTTREITAKADAYLKSPEFQESAIKSVGMLFSQGPKSFFQKIQIFTKNQYYMVRALFRPSIMPAEDFQSLINYLIPDVDIRATRIPFQAVTTDLITGKQVVLSEGSLRQAVLASCSVPGAVEPTRLGEWLLADGGVTSLVPVHAARAAGADVVIAVMVDRDLPADTGITTAKDVLYRAGEITANALEAAEVQNADVVIHPAVGDLHWTDFSRAKDLVAIGEEATRAALEKIQASLPLTRRFSRFTQRFFKTEKNRNEIGTPYPPDNQNRAI